MTTSSTNFPVPTYRAGEHAGPMPGTPADMAAELRVRGRAGATRKHLLMLAAADMIDGLATVPQPISAMAADRAVHPWSQTSGAHE